MICELQVSGSEVFAALGLRIAHSPPTFSCECGQKRGNGHILDAVLHSSPRVSQLFLRHSIRKYKLEYFFFHSL